MTGLSFGDGLRIALCRELYLHLDSNEARVEHVLRKVGRLLGKDLRILRYVGNNNTLSLIG